MIRQRLFDHRHVFLGAIVGLIATVPMTIVMVGLHRLLPRHERYPLAPREITEIETQRLGLAHRLSENERKVITAVAHFGYGAMAGAIYAPVAIYFSAASILSGMAYGMVVWLGSYLGLLPALGILEPATKHPTRRNILMIVAHFIWGAVLGQGVQHTKNHVNTKIPIAKSDP